MACQHPRAAPLQRCRRRHPSPSPPPASWKRSWPASLQMPARRAGSARLWTWPPRWVPSSAWLPSQLGRVGLAFSGGCGGSMLKCPPACRRLSTKPSSCMQRQSARQWRGLGASLQAQQPAAQRQWAGSRWLCGRRRRPRVAPSLERQLSRRLQVLQQAQLPRSQLQMQPRQEPAKSGLPLPSPLRVQSGPRRAQQRRQQPLPRQAVWQLGQQCHPLPLPQQL